MTQRWTGAAAGASCTARRSRAEARAGVRGGRVDHHVQHGRAVTGGREHGTPHEVLPPPGQHEALARRRAGGMRDRPQLRLGQGRVVAGRARPGHQRREGLLIGRGQPPQLDHRHVHSVHCRQRNPVP